MCLKTTVHFASVIPVVRCVLFGGMSDQQFALCRFFPPKGILFDVFLVEDWFTPMEVYTIGALAGE